tara:strand:- start:158 stop:1093 length:936 start_codon:yes stop_codon:yes gene_type:complete
MAIRTPLYYDSGNLKEMSTVMVDQIIDQIVYQYSLNPSVKLSVVSSGGNLSGMTDTRLQAGAVSTNVSSFPSEGTTQEPQTVTVDYDKVSFTNESSSPTADTGKTFPVYLSSGNIHAMTLADVRDTFLHPAIDLLTLGSTGSSQGGTYTIHTASALANATLVSATPIFVDTKADTSAYSAGTIGDHALDNPTTITSYYLHRLDGTTSSYTAPLFIRGDNNLQTYPDATFNSLMQGWIRKTATSSTDGYAISYNIGTSGLGNTRGSGIANTILSGSGDYQTRYVNTDDYRAQEFPDGASTTAATYYLRVLKN